MYLIPILNTLLVVVLFAASRTVKRDYLRRTAPRPTDTER